MPATWASGIPLTQMDLVSTPERVDVLLHTGQLVPSRTLFQSSSKIILEIENVEPAGTVKTAFSGDRRLSHVILQPLGNQRLRVTLKGRELGTPSVGFKAPTASSAFQPVVTELPAPTQAFQEAVPSDLDLNAPLTLAEEDAPEADTTLLSPTVEQKPVVPVAEPVTALPTPVASSKPAASAAKLAPKTEIPLSLPEGWQTWALSGMAILTLIGGLALFIKTKLSQPKTLPPIPSQDMRGRVKRDQFMSEPIGLRGLDTAPPRPAKAAALAANLDPLPPKRPAVPPTQAVAQYRKTLATPPRRTSQAIKRTVESGPLPGNPEVLNFLRSVADIMEKDPGTLQRT